MLNCQICDTPCFNFEETEVCPREATLPPAVCPMFEDIPIDECPGVDFHPLKESTLKVIIP